MRYNYPHGYLCSLHYHYIEQLRSPAFAMMQKVVSELAETGYLLQRILLLEEMLILPRKQRFGKKGETLARQNKEIALTGCWHMPAETSPTFIQQAKTPGQKWRSDRSPD